MLNVDTFFHSALSKSDAIEELTDGRVFNPACKEKDLEGPLPYVIVRLQSVGCSQSTKDTIMCPFDSAVVEILAVGKEREDVAELADAIHSAIRDEVEQEDFEDFDYEIEEIRPMAGDVVYDDLFDCCAQTLTYQCNVIEK